MANTPHPSVNGNTYRDFEKTITIAELMKENLKCNQVLVVVPYQDVGLSQTTIIPLVQLLDKLQEQ